MVSWRTSATLGLTKTMRSAPFGPLSRSAGLASAPVYALTAAPVAENSPWLRAGSAAVSCSATERWSAGPMEPCSTRWRAPTTLSAGARRPGAASVGSTPPVGHGREARAEEHRRIVEVAEPRTSLTDSSVVPACRALGSTRGKRGRFERVRARSRAKSPEWDSQEYMPAPVVPAIGALWEPVRPRPPRGRLSTAIDNRPVPTHGVCAGVCISRSSR